jgi:hypothetical protein
VLAATGVGRCGGGAAGAEDRMRMEMRRRSGGDRGLEEEEGDAEEERRRTSFSTPRCTDKEGRRKKKNLTMGPGCKRERRGGNFVNTETTLLYIRCTWARVYRIGTQWHIFSRRRIVMA